MKKRILAAGLALTLLCGAFVPTTLAVETKKVTPFADILDPQVSEAAELLRLLGVVEGTGSNIFNPGRTLSRAEFCKMAVELMGNGDKVPAQMNRTIFKDVPSTHWARGYINVATQGAASGETTTPGIIRGDATGCFHPDAAITYAEAITILMRVLGYDDSSVGFGAAWYDGYMATADSIDLTDGLSLSPTGTITRGQAAILFYNLYFTEPKGSKDSYLVSKGGKEEDSGVVLDVDATADDGTTGAFQTTKATYKTDRTFSATLEGQEGKVLLDADGKLLAFQPKEKTSTRAVNIIAAEATYLTASGGEKLTVEQDAVVYRDGKATTWKDVYLNLALPTSVTLHYGANGKLAYLFFAAPSADGLDVMVARTLPSGNSNPFAALTGSGSYSMFKNGVAATAADIRQYDVATWDSGARILQVSDLKLTGVYEAVSPSPAAPITIRVMGKDFDVLSTARDDLAAFKVGDKITLLLTADNKVAGAVSADVVKGDAVGIATISETKATVKLLQGGLEVSGTVSKGTAERYNNQLVTVTSSAKDRLSLSAVSGSAAKSDLDVSQRRLGDRDVAENVAVYDRVKDGKTVKVDYDSLTLTTIPKSKISFVSYDYAGRVKYMVLDDVTGDTYDYGYFYYTPVETTRVPVLKYGADGKPETNPDGSYVYETDSNGNIIYENEQVEGSRPTLCVKWADADGNESYSTKGGFTGSVRNSVPGGVALSADGRVAATVTLKSLTGVKRSAFDSEEMTVTVAGVSYPVSAAVQCYNKTTKTWFKPGKEGMEAARAYSDDLTLYYDRSPSEGGKIRMIVIP